MAYISGKYIHKKMVEFKLIFIHLLHFIYHLFIFHHLFILFIFLAFLNPREKWWHSWTYLDCYPSAALVCQEFLGIALQRTIVKS